MMLPISGLKKAISKPWVVIMSPTDEGATPRPSLFSHKKGLKNYIRLSFAFYDEDVLAEGALRLGKVISENLS